MLSKKKDLPLKVCQDIESLITEMYSISISNSDIIEKDNSNSLISRYLDSDPNSDFYFEVISTDFVKNVTSFKVKFKPGSQSNTAVRETSYNKELVIKVFNGWIRILRGYSSVSFSIEEKLLKDYENDFFTDFKLIDEDANTDSFTFQQQLFLDGVILEMIEILSKNDISNEDEIIIDLKELARNQQNLVKNSVIKQFCVVFAKIRKRSIPLMKSIYEVLELKPNFFGMGIDVKKAITEISKK